MLELRERLIGLRPEGFESSLLLRIGGTVKIECETFIRDGEETLGKTEVVKAPVNWRS